MMIIEESLEPYPYYLEQKDSLIRYISYSIVALLYINGIREQISEITLLQLIPGIYLILIFAAFIFLIIWSKVLNEILSDFDNEDLSGLKTRKIKIFKTVRKTRTILYLSIASLTLCSVLPLSLDSFISYGEGEIESIWSFDEVINLELLLLAFLVFLSQYPLSGFSKSNTEKLLRDLPKSWKFLSFIVFLFAAFLTPTIDGYTQFLFSFCAITLSLFVILSTKERVGLYDQGFVGFVS